MNLFLASALLLLVVMLLLWLLSLALRNASIVDPFWGAGFALLAAFAFFYDRGPGLRPVLVLAVAAIWGLRLSLHLSLRNLGHGEDYRYADMRKNHGPRFWWVSLITVFLFQGLLMGLIALPLQVAIHAAGPSQLGWLDGLGLLLWLCGFAFEAIGDHQLKQFKANPANRGKVLDTGLWRYTRHPNYFGDALLWWGHVCFAFATGAWWTVYSPAVMTYLLRNFSGVTLLEQKLIQTKPGFREYAQRTSPFIPWPPKS